MKVALFCTWEDVPHLDASTKASILASVPPWQRDSRTKGTPELGAGAVYTVPESEFVVPPIQLQPHWPRCYALDVGWKRNAVIFGAIDRDTNTLYLYDELYKAKTEPSVIASAVRQRGEWIPGVVDPAARGRSQKDGVSLLSIYRDLGLDIRPAINSVEAGLMKVWERLSQGNLKVFQTCTNFLAEYRLYRRDLKGNIVKSNDHLMDACRYLVMSGLDRAIVEPKGGESGRKWWDWQAPNHAWAG